jgi:5-methylcytosine-specific restriction endonuclease McrBC GTP-binding regulatory subunit McrB
VSKRLSNILNSWKEVARKFPKDVHFDFLGNSSNKVKIERGVSNFIGKGDETSFKEFWKLLYSAQQKARAENVWNTNRASDLTKVIEEISRSEEYQENWENILHNTRNSLRELFGWLHIENSPLYNSCAKAGLEFFGYHIKDNYSDFRNKFEDFKMEFYLRLVGHSTSDTPHEVPINIEMDQLFNVLDKLKGKDIEKARDMKIKELYELILKEKEVNYWQISPGYAEGDALEVWPEFRQKGIIGIGWDKLGDLEEYNTIDDIKKQLISKFEYKNPKNSARSLWYFVNEIKNGDVVIAKKGSSKSIYGVGIIGSDYEFNEEREGFKHIRKVNWLRTFDEPKELPTLKRNFVQWTVGPIEKYRVSEIEKLLEIDVSRESKVTMQKLKSSISQLLDDKKQIILYGPPGTGKTYITRRYAVEFIDGEEYSNETELKRRYEELREEGRIDFVTFHQSYGYEEFVEGIKPVLKDEEKLKYELVDGIFKRICINALFELIKGTLRPDEENFEASIKKFKEKNPIGTELKTVTGRGKFEITNYLDTSIRIQLSGNPTHTYSLSYTQLEKLFKIRNEINRVTDVFKIGEVTEGLSPYYFAVLRELKKYKSKGEIEKLRLTEQELSSQKKKKFILKYLKNKGGENQLNESPRFVLIIDEINRGDISRVFGELITLVEGDKRLGAENKLIVTLPSQEPFGVPPNLYIIATMNTADRSIALIDIALRRRFAFYEMMPDYEVLFEKLLGQKVAPEEEFSVGSKIDSLKISNLLTSDDYKRLSIKLLYELNQRIIKTLDRDHQIGHSYFLRANKENEDFDIRTLRQIWYHDILPLLQEYYYNSPETLKKVVDASLDGELKKEEYDKGFLNVVETEGEIISYEVNRRLQKDSEQGNDEFLKAIKKLANIKSTR